MAEWFTCKCTQFQNYARNSFISCGFFLVWFYYTHYFNFCCRYWFNVL